MYVSFLRNCIYALLLLGGHLSLFSCQSTSSQGWAFSGSRKFIGSVRLGTVKTEKTGNSLSIEREIGDLLPLLMGEIGLKLGGNEEKTDFIADVYAREREYNVDWRSERSLSIEVRLRPDDGTGTEGMPLAAGQVISRGKASFSSSETLKALLRRALRRTGKALRRTGASIPKPVTGGTSDLSDEAAGILQE
ncbi:MAG: hypothetical protein LBP76_09240 [Treponema sp.]|jgi:hypothetical protein|nr:hypothetical protein [Treponema sp.]